MLSETQLQIVIKTVNENYNIPILSESHEGEIIRKLVERINPAIEPSLRVIMPDIYVECIRIALQEGVSAAQRREQISERLCGELEPGLTRELNERVDSSLVPDRWEDDLLKVVSKKIIREFVEWTVGELDEKLARGV